MSCNWFKTVHVNKQRWLRLSPELKDKSGIYILTRTDENGFKFAYVGQAVKVLERLARHLCKNKKMQHIDKSLIKHKMYAYNNPHGWDCVAYYFEEDLLNDKEREYIKKYAESGYQLLNETLGGQDKGKAGLRGNSGGLGYRNGVAHGYEKCRKEIAEKFAKYLNFSIKPIHITKNGEFSKTSQRIYDEFVEYLNNK